MNYVLSHCDSDGRFAAFCAFMALKDQDVTVFKEVQYGEDFPFSLDTFTKNDTVYILDFSYVRTILESLNAVVGKLVVLDHHKSAMDELEGLPYALFDVTKSGALLAWEYFNPNTPAPWVCTYVNDRDLWEKKYIESTYLESYLRFKKVGLDWKEWDLLTHHEGYLANAIAQGKMIKDVEDSLIRKVFVSRRHHCGIHPQYQARFVVYNCPGIMHSEVAESYYTGMPVDMTFGWRVIDNGKTMLFNLRSPGKIDVSNVAKDISKLPGGLSGGGHPNAAGATMRFDDGIEFVKQLLKH